ncbi:hypothetical protein HWN39_10660 [Lactobacillus rhamnosus]|uniref:Uncharacterized protein n=1 Tax=Lacticaseibacillus rhamnosus TaxID=47715 RepID=A0A7Y7QGZ0_LACRH|nr:hypothetical protein [Lacticaseibacillus rhamnosus]NVO88939.1 hypothetical protein [Lacticaseibacillus rhamnosus]
MKLVYIESIDLFVAMVSTAATQPDHKTLNHIEQDIKAKTGSDCLAVFGDDFEAVQDLSELGKKPSNKDGSSGDGDILTGIVNNDASSIKLAQQTLKQHGWKLMPTYGSGQIVEVYMTRTTGDSNA